MRKSGAYRRQRIVGRLISSAQDSNLVGGRHVRPASRVTELAERYGRGPICNRNRSASIPAPHTGLIFATYVPEELLPAGKKTDSIPPPCCSWVFLGPDAVEKIRQHCRPYCAREHQRRNDFRDNLRAIISPMIQASDYFEPGCAGSSVRPQGGRAGFEALGGIFGF